MRSMARINLPGVNSFRDRHGRLRHYFRRKGAKAVPLPGLPGSAEFMAKYQMELAAAPAPVETAADRTSPGTVNALAVSYYKSDEWLHQLGEDTRKTRKRIIERFRLKHGDKRVAMLRREHVLAMLAEIRKPTAKRH